MRVIIMKNTQKEQIWVIRKRAQSKDLKVYWDFDRLPGSIKEINRAGKGEIRDN